jgi:Cutinase
VAIGKSSHTLIDQVTHHLVNSQGAQLAHNALGLASDAAKKSVAAVVSKNLLSMTIETNNDLQVVFGDPNKGKAIPGITSDRIYTNCASDDPICKGVPLPIGSHLTYGSNTEEMNKIVTFVKNLVQSVLKPAA